MCSSWLPASTGNGQATLPVPEHPELGEVLSLLLKQQKKPLLIRRG
ncbi:hypothetical protein [Deinococcus cavernae]|nr:hypothetical protein [Deinococcus cavernae]